MRVLLDTCVISEIVRTQGAERVKKRVAAFRPLDVFVSAITIGEMARGVALLPSGKRKDGYTSALLQLEQDYDTRILPIDTDAARIWGELDAAGKKSGRNVSVTDGLIAATAIRHGLHVVTRNVKDFKGSGALIINPWEDA